VTRPSQRFFNRIVLGLLAFLVFMAVISLAGCNDHTYPANASDAIWSGVGALDANRSVAIHDAREQIRFEINQNRQLITEDQVTLRLERIEQNQWAIMQRLGIEPSKGK
jgi:hypothetical protein